jgi:hypothetical protein
MEVFKFFDSIFNDLQEILKFFEFFWLEISKKKLKMRFIPESPKNFLTHFSVSNINQFRFLNI